MQRPAATLGLTSLRLVDIVIMHDDSIAVGLGLASPGLVDVG